MGRPLPTPSGRLLRRIIRGIDASLRRRMGIVEFEQGPEALICIGVRRAGRAMTLSDGTRLAPDDPVLELHLWNEHLPALPAPGATLRWAVSARRQVTRSLQRLAAHLQSSVDLHDVKALCIKPAFAGRNPARNLDWIVAQHGFERIPQSRERKPLIPALHWLDSLWIWLLTWTFNPRSLRGRRFRRLRQEFWIPRSRFIARYGAPSAAAGEPVPMRRQSIAGRSRAG